MRKTKKFPKSVLNLINEINELLPIVENCNDYAGTYGGSTMYTYVILNSPIKVKNQFVYIDSSDCYDNYPFNNRYNVNWKECDLIGLPALKYDLRLIRKAFKQCIKNN